MRCSLEVLFLFTAIRTAAPHIFRSDSGVSHLRVPDWFSAVSGKPQFFLDRLARTLRPV